MQLAPLMAKIKQRITLLSQQIVTEFRSIYTDPFQIDATSDDLNTLEEIERVRRIALTRRFAVSVALVMIIIAIITFWPNHSPAWLPRSMALGEITLSVGTYLLSSTRFAPYAGFLLMYGSFVLLMIFILRNPGGLDARAILIYGFVNVYILGVGLVLPGRFVLPSILGACGITLISIAFAPIRSPLPPGVIDLHELVFWVSCAIYFFTGGLTLMFQRMLQAQIASSLLARERERRIDALKDDFISIASHELKAPLSPIILTSRIIERRAARPEMAAQLPEFANKLVQQALHMGELVDAMLDMTRINTDRFTLDIAHCDVARLITEVVESQEDQWHRHITVRGLDEGPLTGNLDAKRFWQVLTNLLNNALKYSPPDTTVVVDVNVRMLKAQDWLIVRIIDEGPGIAAEHLPHLFERFYRVNDSAHTEFSTSDGLGLGLYITEAIVRAHGGTIEVASTQGQGTTFTTKLPFRQDTSLSQLEIPQVEKE